MSEFTSSGLSHTLPDFFPNPDLIFNMITPHEIIASPIFLGHNYGVLDVPTSENDVVFYGSIRD